MFVISMLQKYKKIISKNKIIYNVFDIYICNLLMLLQ